MPIVNELENRQRARTGVVLDAVLRVEGLLGEHRVSMRNLSAGGVMAVGDVAVRPGSSLSIHIDGIGWVGGVVAWVQDNRFGIAFSAPIDTAAALGSTADPLAS